MNRFPLTHVLFKLFAAGFYRVHAGMLAMLFGTVICYCIFIIPLNETHLDPAQRIIESLFFTLSLLSSPVIMAAVFVAWLVYTYKSWEYVKRQLQLESNLFIFYSVTSFSRRKQFQSWAIVQTVILLPAIGYGLVSFIIGFIFGHYLAPFIVLGYICVLILVSAAIYMRLVNQPAEVTSSYVLRIARYPAKSLFALFLFHIADQQKMTYLVTKVITLLSICSVVYFFDDVTDLRAAGIVMLLVGLAHAVLVFQEFRFDQVYLSFVRNFPVSRSGLYAGIIRLYTLLLLPEAIALLVSFPIVTAAWLFLFVAGIVILFRCILLLATPVTMRNYLWRITAVSVVFFIAILFRQMQLVALLNLPVAGILFFKRYYRVELAAS
jgi:hypothetical protein